MMKLNQKYQVLPDMNEEQFLALKADIAERGVLTPIDVDENGNILDGHHRYRACVELGITDFPTIVRLNLDEGEKRIFARKSNMLRRHLTQEQMREIIAGQLRDTPNWANNRIAQELGVDSKTVGAMREKLEATLEIPKLDKLLGADGKERPVKQKRKPSIMAANEADFNEIIKHLFDLEGGDGFISIKNGVLTITSPNYNPYFGLTEDEQREWDCFGLFLVEKCRWSTDDVSHHIEWLRQRDFRTPSDWLGEEGAHWRKVWWMKQPKPRLIKAWNEYWQDKKEQSLEVIREKIEEIFGYSQTTEAPGCDCG